MTIRHIHKLPAQAEEQVYKLCLYIHPMLKDIFFEHSVLFSLVPLFLKFVQLHNY